MSVFFEKTQAEFYQYMINVGGIAPKTARDYISRLKFLAEHHQLDSKISEDEVRIILEKESLHRLNREKYSSKKAISDFSAGLRKFLDFVRFDYSKHIQSQIDAEISNIESRADLTATMKETVIQSRIGQGVFRKDLVKAWGRCSFSGCDMVDILVASHIKPWRVSDDKERIDPFNGLLLLPNFDKLFDKGYITVEQSGKVKLSKYIQGENIEKLNLANLISIPIQERHKPYLEFHNKVIYMG